ncbi:hypothetical protein SNE35_08780 [Paucibacter sp. R3-3]|uniref:Transcription regulator TrmB N-terminal domain-containing protein n=1 Tax=Roseateles agri TaxID=3098619 RepID=A0ABU5DH71_9BURK|nr:hypothetical protein [Paucibacter sp. R3-3]MDY0744599.1 hypothetical protein [Paucibacter sp. R3-3]
MAIAKNGVAIIGSQVVPASEVIVLKTLVELGKSATVPQIAKALDDKMSDASIYSLLGRLDERRRLVVRHTTVVDVHGTQLRRVLWEPTKSATEFFLTVLEKDEPEQTSGVPVGAAI